MCTGDERKQHRNLTWFFLTSCSNTQIRKLWKRLKRTWKLLRKPFHYSLNDRLLAVCTGYHWCIQPHTIIRNSVKVKGACNGVQKMTSLPSHCILNIPNVRFLQLNRSTCSIYFWRRCNIKLPVFFLLRHTIKILIAHSNIYRRKKNLPIFRCYYKQ